MDGSLSATTHAWIALGLAFFVCPRSIPFSLRARAVLLWAAAAPVVFMLDNTLAALLAAGAVLCVLAPVSAPGRCAFFLIAVPAVPIFISAPLPFPGINYLIELSSDKISAIVLLVPVLFALAASDRDVPLRTHRLPDVAVVVFVFFTAFLVALAYSATVGFRFLVDQILLLAVPYFAISRMVRRRVENIDILFQAFIVASVILACVALVSAVRQWDFYGVVNPHQFAEVRDGLMRIGATANTHSLAYHLAAAILVLEFLRRRMSIGWMRLNALRLLFLAGMLATGSRGALSALVVGIGVYALAMMTSVTARVLTLSVALIGVMLAGLWLLFGDVASVDEHGTFVYRQDLLLTSVKYVLAHPFVGNVRFMESGFFDHLVQGQGIIDVTNLYLQVALAYGLIGVLIFYLFIIHEPLAGLRAVFRTSTAIGDEARPDEQAGSWTSRRDVRPARRAASPWEREVWRRAAAVSVAAAVGWLWLITTTSNVGLTMHLGIVFAALCKGLREIQPQPATLASRPGLMGRRPDGVAVAT